MNFTPRHGLIVGTLAALSLPLGGGCESGDGSPMAIPTCEGRGDEYFAGIAKTTTDDRASVEIMSAAPAPPANSYTNKWTLRVTDAATMAAMPGVLVVAAPYMIDHGHGSPSVYGTDLGDGVYMIDPLSLKMNGLWDVTIKVIRASGAGSDAGDESDESRVVFKFCVVPI